MKRIKTFKQFEAMDPDAFAKALDQMQPKKMDDYQKPSYAIHQTMSTKKGDGKTFRFGGGDPDKQSDRPYVVKKGDTVYGIAKQLGLSVKDFVSMYMGDVKDPNKLSVGQEIYLPGPLVSKLELGQNPDYDQDLSTQDPGTRSHLGGYEFDDEEDWSIQDPNTRSHISGYDFEDEDDDSDFRSKDRAYVVKQGETIYSIAKKLGMSVNNFMDIYGYGIEDASKVKAGTEIYLPGHMVAQLGK